MDLGIEDKHAFISGGSHGIGLASALALAAEGCDITFCSRQPHYWAEAVDRIKQLGVLCTAIQADVADCEEIVNQCGPVDILINNVGGGGRWGNDNVLDTDFQVWQEVFDKNVWSSLNLTKAFLPYMMQREWGRVVWVTSVYGTEIGGKPWFNIAKTSQTVMMKNFATDKELVRHGVTFNSVAPGDIMMPDTGWDKERLSNPDFDKILDSYPMGRMGTAEEVGSVVAFLSSNQAAYVNGSSVSVDGGQSRSL